MSLTLVQGAYIVAALLFILALAASVHWLTNWVPEVTEGTQFGNPVWRAGKKVFAQCSAWRGETVKASFWVGVDRQGLMTMDPRFSIPPYLGPGGWIALDLSQGIDAAELRSLALESYRHYATRRMLAELKS